MNKIYDKKSSDRNIPIDDPYLELQTGNLIRIHALQKIGKKMRNVTREQESILKRKEKKKQVVTLELEIKAIESNI